MRLGRWKGGKTAAEREQRWQAVPLRGGLDAVENVKRQHGVLVLVLKHVTFGEKCGDDADADDKDDGKGDGCRNAVG